MKERPDLLPCPFCGSRHVVLSAWKDLAYVACLDCGVRTEVYLYSHCAENAVAHWNKRMEPKEEVTDEDAG